MNWYSGGGQVGGRGLAKAGSVFRKAVPTIDLEMPVGSLINAMPPTHTHTVEVTQTQTRAKE